MGTPYRRAVDALLCELGEGASEDNIVRVDPHRSGGTVLQSEDTSGYHWHQHWNEELARISLRGDRWLPSADLLGEVVEEGGGRLLGWRPGRRATVLKEEGTSTRILKGYRKGRSGAACLHYELAMAAALGSRLRVPTLVVHDPRRGLLEMEELPGAPIRLDLDQVDAFFRIGHGLRAFQGMAPDGRLGTHDRPAEMSLLSTLAERVLELRGRLPEGWASAEQLLRCNVPSRPPTELVLTHRDLHDGQLLVDEGGIGLLDFDLLCLAEPVLDVANLSAHLRLRAIQGIAGASETAVEELSAALLDGLDRSAEQGFSESLRFYQATTFLRLSLVYFLRPQWQAVVPPLVALSSRCIHELAST